MKRDGVYRFLRVTATVILGALLVLVFCWARNAYFKRVMYAPTGIHGQPDPYAIARLGKPAIPVICAEVDHIWQGKQANEPLAVLISWVTALGYIGDKSAVPTLIALMDHASPEVRLQTTLALYRLQDSRSLPALRRAAKDRDKKVAEAAVSAAYAVERAYR